MAILTKAQLEALNQSSFPDQSTEAITPAILRTYNTATIDTLVDSLDTGSFSTDISALNAFTASQLNINSGLNASTASQQISINALNAATSSYVSSAITASSLITASVSGQTLTFTKGDASTFDVTLPAGSGSATIPTGTVSSSAQIIELGFLQTSSFNSYTSSTNSSISQLNASSASQQTQINSLIAATGSYVSSAITASSLVTASFSGNTLTFTKGDASTFGVVIPDVSGSAGTTIYEVVYTGENITKGDSLYISGSQGANPIVYKADAADPNKMPVTFIANETIGASNTTNAIVLGLIEGIDLTGYTAGQTIYVAEGGGWSTNLPSGSNSITQLLGVVTKGGSGGKGLVLNPGPAQLPGLDTGKFWVGNGSNQPTEISSASFATTGSNTFTGTQNIIGGVKVIGDALSIQGNIAGSGSQYPNAQLVIDFTDSANIYATYQAVDNFNNGVFNVGINSYNAKDGGNATFAIQGGGNVSGDNTILTVNPTTPETLKFWKPETTFNSNVTITGSIKINPTSVSTNASYVIPFISGSTLSKDSVDTLFYNPSSNQLLVSASTGQSNINPNLISFSSGSGTSQYSSTLSKNAFTQVSSPGYYIGLSGNPSQIGAPSLTSNTKPALLALSSSGQPYVAIELQNSQSFSDGRVTAKRLLVAESGIEVTGSTVLQTLTASLQEGYVWVGDSAGKTTLVATSSFSSFVSGSVPEGTVSSSAQILNYGIFATTGSNTFIGNQYISGALKVASDGLSIQGNLAGSGSPYAGAQLVTDFSDPANIYSTFQGVDAFNNGIFGIGINSYNPKDGGAANFWIGGGQSVGGDNTILTANSSNSNLQFWKPNTIFNSNVSVTGSTNLKSTTVSGSFLTNGGARFGNNTSQYNNIELKTSTGSFPGDLYNTIYINPDNNGAYSAGMGVSTYTEFGSNPVAFIFGGGNGNNVDGANTAIKLANGDIYIQKDTSILGTTTFNKNADGVAINVLTGSIDTNGSIFFKNPPYYAGTSNNQAQFAMTGVSYFSQKFGDTNQSGSSLLWEHNTGSLKSSVDLTAKYNGVEGSIGIQNLNGSTSVIINVNDSVEIKGNIKLEKGTDKATGVVTTGAGGATVTNSLVTTNSIILLTTQNNNIAGTLYPATVGSISGGSFTISHNYGSSGLVVAYMIINPAP